LLLMSVRKGAIEALIGVLVGFLPLVVKILSPQNADWIIAFFELGTVVGSIKAFDTVKNIPLATAIGYFIVTRAIGWPLMPDWERGLQTILFIIYAVSLLDRR